jgi:hypothetical protein
VSERNGAGGEERVWTCANGLVGRQVARSDADIVVRVQDKNGQDVAHFAHRCLLIPQGGP